MNSSTVVLIFLSESWVVDELNYGCTSICIRIMDTSSNTASETGAKSSHQFDLQPNTGTQVARSAVIAPMRLSPLTSPKSSPSGRRKLEK